MRLLKDIYYSKEEREDKSLDLYIPDGECRAVFLYIHGGGIENGDKGNFYREGVFLAEHGYASVSINYPMYPKAAFPEFLYAAAEAVAWTRRNIKKFFGCERIYIGGESAGAYISMMLCFDRRYLMSVGLTNADVAGYWHAAGQPTAHFNVLKYSGVDPRRVIVDERAPVYFIGTENGYPYMRFTVSDNDMTARYEQTMMLLKTMEHFGYQGYDLRVAHGTHCSYFKTVLGDGNTEASYMILDFLETAEGFSCRKEKQ